MIKMFVMDVDGTLTDGQLYFGDNGELFKKFHVKDGYGIHLLIKHGIIPIIMTGRISKIVETRFNELGVTEIHQGIDNKLLKLREIIARYNFQLSEIAYVGDDESDLDVMMNVGFPFALSNSIVHIKSIAIDISTLSGGDGAVREIIDLIINNYAKRSESK